MAELAALYDARGVEPALAREVARQLSRDPEQALEIHAREELGIDPGDLPSPLVAAVSSFGSFALGALLPVLPYLLGATALWPAVLLALVGLFALRRGRRQGDRAELVVQRAAAARSGRRGGRCDVRPGQLVRYGRRIDRLASVCDGPHK